MLVYLSGPMTGLPNENYPAFHEAAARLRAIGFDVLNPAETAGGATHLPRHIYMDVDIGYVKAADAVVVMQGWRNSDGAKLEAIVASSMDKPVFTYDPRTGLGSLVSLDGWAVETTETPVEVDFDALREQVGEEAEHPTESADGKIVPLFDPFPTEVS